MPVRFLESEYPVTTMPRREKFRLLEERLSPSDFVEIEAALNAQINENEIHTSSWMPGTDWTNTPYQSIYEKAARYNYELSAQLFGLMVFYVFMQRPEPWITGKFEKDGEPISGRTYFIDRR